MPMIHNVDTPGDREQHEYTVGDITGCCYEYMIIIIIIVIDQRDHLSVN